MRPVELAVKNVVDDQYCYTQTRTECRETTKNVDREICTYSYSSVRETRPAQTTQVTASRIISKNVGTYRYLR